MEEKSAFESFELDVNQEIKEVLGEVSKWSYFLSILGFIGIGFLMLAGIIVAFSQGTSEGGLDSAYGLGTATGVMFFYIIFALVYFFPVLYLFKFSKNMKNALRLSTNQDFKVAFLNLKSHYKYLGIFSIVIISLYVLIIIGAVAGTTLY